MNFSSSLFFFHFFLIFFFIIIFSSFHSCQQLSPLDSVKSYNYFSSTDGANPFSSIIRHSNGVMYGTSERGGRFNFGSIFQLSEEGKISTIYSFEGKYNSLAKGFSPRGTIISMNNLFFGIAAQADSARGAIWSFDPVTREIKYLKYFTGGLTDGSDPKGGLMKHSSGFIFGTCNTGGNKNVGIIYRIMPDGSQ